MASIAFIDVTATTSYGGVQTAVWSLAACMADRGHKVAVAGGRGSMRAPAADGVQVLTFDYTPRQRFPNLGTRFRKLAERVSFARRARAEVADRGFDWIVLTKPLDFFWPLLLPKNSPTRFAFMSGGTDYVGFDRSLSHRISAWAACSHFNAWQIYSRFKRFPTVIYNGVDTARFAPRPGNAATRASLGFQPDETVFAFAGRIVGWKGLAFAVTALAHPALVALPVKLLLIGNGAQRQELVALAQHLGVDRRVYFHSAVAHEQLPALYAAADAGVFPSIGDEAFGITIAEAMSCGKPVVASHIGGIPEVVGNEESCGLLVAPGDVAGLARAMRRLALDGELRARMGQAARARIVRHFTWGAAAARLLGALGLPCT